MRPRISHSSRELPRSGLVRSDPGPRVVERFREIYAVLKERLDDAEKKLQLASSQIWALSVISSGEEIGVNNLAKTMGIHQSTASNLLRPLLERGLVVSKRSMDDGRAVHLKLTPKGKRMLKQAPGPFGGVLSEALTELDPATLRRLERDLGRLVKVLSGGRAQPDGLDGHGREDGAA